MPLGEGNAGRWAAGLPDRTQARTHRFCEAVASPVTSAREERVVTLKINLRAGGTGGYVRWAAASSQTRCVGDLPGGMGAGEVGRVRGMVWQR